MLIRFKIRNCGIYINTKHCQIEIEINNINNFKCSNSPKVTINYTCTTVITYWGKSVMDYALKSNYTPMSFHN